MSTLSFRLSIAAIVVVVGFGAVLDVMEVDAAQYAAMSADMLHQDNWLKLYHRGEDYLDKPPLLFWLSALSFKIFGIHNWSYKLPSILYAFLGLYSTYRFVRMFHGEEVARRAVLMLGSSAAFLLMTNDVRCDTILTSSVITAIWAGAAWLQERRWWQLILLTAAIASGMLVKGPMGAVAPVLALGGHVLLARQWNMLRDLRWLVVPVLVALALVPMCIGLYEQYGMHGLRFYFWEQSFGRITGENRWKDDSTALFFTHEVLWQLLPWTLFVLLGMWNTLRSMLRRERLPEYVSISGVVLVFAALSLSHFKLPHYLYVIVPLFAVLAARAWPNEPMRGQRYAQTGLVLLLAMVAFWLAWVAFPSKDRWWALALIFLPTSVALYQRIQHRGVTLFHASFVLMIGVGLVINTSIYPSILSYQANAQVGKWVAERGLGPDRFGSVAEGGTSLNFYAGFTVPFVQNASELALPVHKGQVIYTNAHGRDALVELGATPVRSTEFPNYPVQLLSVEFLDPAQRLGILERKFLLEF
jgi:4-amino-4-deoxy-L-arabinose transferase-like glycosyltransferase